MAKTSMSIHIRSPNVTAPIPQILDHKNVQIHHRIIGQLPPFLNKC